MSVADVLEGRADYSVEKADAIAWFNAMPERSLDLVCGSPPYCDARTYGIGAQRDCEAWVAWMLEVTAAAHRACKGPVFWVVAGVTRDRCYWPGCEGLAWEWWKRGGDCQLYRPCIYRRVGIPGSGGDDYLRADWEYVLAFKHAGPLPWSDNTAMGHPPKWAPGGEMSHRLSNGTRVNQWGPKGSARGMGTKDKDGFIRPGQRPSHAETTAGGESEGIDLFGDVPPKTDEAAIQALADAEGISRKAAANRLGGGEKVRTNAKGKCNTRNLEGGMNCSSGVFVPPAIANPGTVVQERYEFTAEEIAKFIGEPSSIVDCVVGGGRMGNTLASDNEAPYPERLPEFFIRSFCPPGGIVADCFSGSGTTAAVALRWGRKAVACDLRQSQVDLSLRRIATETPLALFD